MKSIWLSATFLISAVASATAADLPARSYTKAPAIAAAYDWSGWYAGANGGYGWGDDRTGVFSSTNDIFYYGSALAVGYLPTNYGAKHDGGFGGVQAGYNMQSGIWLVGIEADIQGADIGRTANSSFPGVGGGIVPSVSEARDHIDWFGTVRGRAGFVVDRVLFYGTGGFAYGGVRSSFRTADLGNVEPVVGSSSGTRIGWAAGAGIEWAVGTNWTIRAEYLHVDLGSTDVQGLTIPSPTELITYRYDHNFDAARIGINYKFGGPVIAKY